MKKTLLILSSILTGTAFSQVVINEIQPSTNTVELKNIGSTAIDASTYWLCSFPDYTSFGSISVLSGTKTIAPGEFLVVKTGYNLGITDGELGLYSSNSFSSSNAILDYVEWGSSGHRRSSVATGAEIWFSDEFVSGVDENLVLVYDGAGDMAADFKVSGLTSFGKDNTDALGLFTSTEKEEIEIYPNPAQNNILVSGKEGSAYFICNTFGQSVQEGIISSDGISVSNLTSGAYTLQLITESGTSSVGFVKE